MPHLLIVDDDAAIRETLAEIGRDSGFSVALAASIKDAMIQLERQAPDLVLTDVRLPEGSGMDIFKNAAAASAEVVVMTGHGTVDNAVQALRLGATDYLVKPICMERLNDILTRIAAGAGGDLAGQPFEEPGRFGKMYGASERMRDLYRQLGRVAPTNVTTLVIGESGTGKELAAHAIHELSPRRQRPFIAVNCGAISPNLIESEMFGHERGSFTGADRQHKGYFERADGGTLFLDEVGDLSPAAQVKLLRVLQSGEVERLGDDQTRKVNVRLVAATNVNLPQAIRQGSFRADLYYRLATYPVAIPPLRDRRSDIPLLAQALLGKYEAVYHKKLQGITDRAIRALVDYPWPGNVRELENTMHRALILTPGDTVSAETVRLCLPHWTAEEVAPAVGASPRPPASPLPAPAFVPGIGLPAISAQPAGEIAGSSPARPANMKDLEREHILATLREMGGSRKKAVEKLGISERTLRYKLQQYRDEGYDV